MTQAELPLSPEVRALIYIYENRLVRLPVLMAPAPPGVVESQWRATFGGDLSVEDWSAALGRLAELQLLHAVPGMMHLVFGLTPIGIEAVTTIKAKLAEGVPPAYPIPPSSPQWGQGYLASATIFISHSHHDNDFCRRIDGDLKRSGFQSWFDLNNLMPGDSLVAKIDYGLENSDYVLIIYSRQAAVSPWVQREYRAAIAMETKGMVKRVIVIKVDDAPLPPMLIEKRYLEFYDETYTVRFKELLSSLGIAE